MFPRQLYPTVIRMLAVNLILFPSVEFRLFVSSWMFYVSVYKRINHKNEKFIYSRVNL